MVTCGAAGGPPPPALNQEGSGAVASGKRRREWNTGGAWHSPFIRLTIAVKSMGQGGFGEGSASVARNPRRATGMGIREEGLH